MGSKAHTQTDTHTHTYDLSADVTSDLTFDATRCNLRFGTRKGFGFGPCREDSWLIQPQPSSKTMLLGLGHFEVGEAGSPLIFSEFQFRAF